MKQNAVCWWWYQREKNSLWKMGTNPSSSKICFIWILPWWIKSLYFSEHAAWMLSVRVSILSWLVLPAGSPVCAHCTACQRQVMSLAQLPFACSCLPLAVQVADGVRWERQGMGTDVHTEILRKSFHFSPCVTQGWCLPQADSAPFFPLTKTIFSFN